MHDTDPTRFRVERCIDGYGRPSHGWIVLYPDAMPTVPSYCIHDTHDEAIHCATNLARILIGAA
jgi:hypothetical protein